MTSIPGVDLGIQHREIEAEVRAGMERVFARNAYILGEEVADFEERFARFVGVRHCIGVGSGTDALELALRAVGVTPGDEVVLPANTFIATALAVVRAGGHPVLVDCDPVHHLMDPERTAAVLTARTRVILPVHLFGQMAHVEPLEKLASESGAVLVEDAAQCQGASRSGRSAGSVGRAAGTSFYPGKNLGAYGDAGAVLTDDDATALAVRALRNYGGSAREHPVIGFNSRLDTLQAVVLLAKLARLDAWNQARREAAERYHALLAAHAEIERPRVLPGNTPVWHLYVVRLPDATLRDAALARLQAAGIGASIHYPVPVHRTGAFAHLGHGPGSFPVAEDLAGRMLSLPIFPGILEEQQARVVETLVGA